MTRHDCVYFAVITSTTVGFGDIAVPEDAPARAAMAMVMLIGTPLFGAALAGCVEALRGGDRPISFDAFRRELQAAGALPEAACVGREELLGFLLVRDGAASMGDVQRLLVELSRLDLSDKALGSCSVSDVLGMLGRGRPDTLKLV